MSKDKKHLNLGAFLYTKFAGVISLNPFFPAEINDRPNKETNNN